MALFKYSLQGIKSHSRRFIHLTSRQTKIPKKLPDPWDLMTGPELWEALQHKKGNHDPWLTHPQKRGPGTRDCPNVVYSFGPSRIVMCRCTEESTSMVAFWVHEGYPRRCKCNYWFVLERVPPPTFY